MMSRALKATVDKSEVAANAVVAFGVNERSIQGGKVRREGKLSEALENEKSLPQDQTEKGTLRKDLDDMEAALKDHPEIFEYLTATVKTDNQTKEQ